MSESPPPTKGVAQRTSRKQRRASDEDEEGEASDASLGSGAMSESESEGEEMPVPTASKELDEPMYPLEGKFRSEEDRRAVLAMPELQREEVLADRAKEVEEQRFRAQLRQRTLAQASKTQDSSKRKATAADLDDSPRKANKARTERGDALEKLKRSRAEKGQRRRSPAQGGRRKSSSEEGSDFDYDDEPRRKGPSKAAVSDVPASVSDLAHITLTRDSIARLCLTPGFEDCAIGCLVRICTGPDSKIGGGLGYRFVQIKHFSAGKPYSLPMPGSTRPVWSDQYVHVTPGLHDQKFLFTQVSNSQFQKVEFQDYELRLTDANAKFPTQAFCQAKEASLRTLAAYAWTDNEITEKLKRQQVLSDPHYLTRIRLIAARRHAEMDDDQAEIARVDKEIAALDATPNEKELPADKKRDLERQERLANISRRNRQANFDNLRYLQMTQRKEQLELMRKIERGEAKPDPLARKPMFAKTFVDANEEDEKRRKFREKSGAAKKDASKLAVPGDKEIDDLFGGSEAGSSRATSPAPGATAGKREFKIIRKAKPTEEDIIGAMELDIDI